MVIFPPQWLVSDTHALVITFGRNPKMECRVLDPTSYCLTKWLFVRDRTHTSQAIRPALKDFLVGFTSMVDAQATKG